MFVGLTRTCLRLDDDGNCYLPGASGIRLPADCENELCKLEACLAALGASTTSYDENAQKRKAMQSKGFRF